MMKNKLTPAQFEQRLREGDPEAYYIVITGESGGLKRYISKILRSPHDVEDIVHDVFMSLIENHEKLKGYSIKNYYGYILSAAKFKAMQILRDRYRFDRYKNHALHSLQDEFSDNPEEIIMSQQIQEIVLRKLDVMPKIRSDVYSMKRIEGLSDVEIAEKLNISQATVRSHYRNALNDIKGALKIMTPFLIIFQKIFTN